MESAILHNPSRAEAECVPVEAYRQLVDGLADEALFLLDGRGRIASWNPAAERMTGYGADDLFGRGYPGCDFRVWLGASLAERQLVRRDGTAFWVAVGVTRIDLPAADFRGFGVHLRDLARRKKAQQAIGRFESRQSEQTRVLERIASGAPLIDVLRDITALIESQIPDALGSILLLDRDRLRLRSGSVASLPEAFSRAIDGVAIGPGVGSCGAAAHFGKTVITSDIATDPLWAEYRGLALSHGLHSCWSVPIFASSEGDTADRGAVLGTFAIYKRAPSHPDAEAERALAVAAHLAGVAIGRERAIGLIRESETSYAIISEITRSITFGLRIHPGGGSTVEWVRPQFGLLSGRSLDEIRRLGWETLFDPADRPHVRRLIDRMLAGETVRGELRLLTKAGESLTVLMQGKRLEPGLIIGGLLDITELKAAEAALLRREEDLRQSHKMEAVGQLAAGIAHDFNNLLTIINGFGELLLSRIAPGQPNRAAAVAIREAGDRAAGLTEQLLAFSCKQVLEPVALDLNAEVTRSLGMLARLIPENIRIVPELHPGAGAVKADRTHLSQVIVNLVVNARDALPHGGEIAVRTRAPEIGSEGSFGSFCVADTGIGMTEEILARIFDPFFSTKGVGRGTGLGLAVVHGIVLQSGGSIRVESRPGAGSTFEVLLPSASGEPTEVAAAPLRESTAGGTETILLVEDDPGVREIAKIALEMHGYRVLAAGDGKAALALAGARIDVLLTDVIMPGMGGRELAEAVRALHPAIRLLYMSGYTDGAVLRDVGPHDAFLQKPFTPQVLARKIRDLLDGPA